MLKNWIHQSRAFSTRKTNPLFAAASKTEKPLKSKTSSPKSSTTSSKPKKTITKKTIEKSTSKSEPSKSKSTQQKDSIGQKSQKAVFEKSNTSLFWEKQSLGTVWIPHELRVVLSNALKGFPRSDLRRQSTVLSELLRARTTTKGSKLLYPDLNMKQSQKQKEDEKKKQEQEEQEQTEPKRDYEIPQDIQDIMTKFNKQAAHQARVNETPNIVYSKGQAMAYIAHRVPGIFGCNVRALSEVTKRLPDFAPKSMLDFGSGPGTTIWAASEVFKDKVTNQFFEQTVAVEPSSAMLSIAQNNLLKDFAGIRWKRFLGAVNKSDRFDLVTCSYALSELKDDAERYETVRALWSFVSPGGVLVLVEPGTPIGSQIIINSREAILRPRDSDQQYESNLPNVLAPCPHNGTCPMLRSTSQSWCHFTQRVQRIPISLDAKLGASRNWEDEKFSFVCIQKVKSQKLEEATEALQTDFKVRHEEEKANEQKEKIEKKLDDKDPKKNSFKNKQANFGDDETLSAGRIMGHPLKRGGHVVVDLCLHSETLERHVVAKSDGKDHYKAARKSKWGDILLVNSRTRRMERVVPNQGVEEPTADEEEDGSQLD